MKHLLILRTDIGEDSPLAVLGLVPYDSSSPRYNPETKGYVELTPCADVTYVDVEDEVDVGVNYTAIKNADGSFSFQKPAWL